MSPSPVIPSRTMELFRCLCALKIVAILMEGLSAGWNACDQTQATRSIPKCRHIPMQWSFSSQMPLLLSVGYCIKTKDVYQVCM